MKFAIVILAVCIASTYAGTLTDEQRTKLRAHKEACIAESGVDAAVVEGIIKGGKIERSEKLDCYSACMLKKVGVMREDGTIDVEGARAKAATTNVNMEKANMVIDKCKDLTGKNTCETGGNVLGCFITNKDFPVLD